MYLYWDHVRCENLICVKDLLFVPVSLFFVIHFSLHLINKSREIWKQLDHGWFYVVAEKVLIMPVKRKPQNWKKKKKKMRMQSKQKQRRRQWRLVSYFNIRLEKNRRKCSTTRQFSQFFHPKLLSQYDAFRWMTYRWRTKVEEKKRQGKANERNTELNYHCGWSIHVKNLPGIIYLCALRDLKRMCHRVKTLSTNYRS